MDVPGAFDRAFLDDCPYDPEILLIDQLLVIDREASMVRCRWPTDPSMPITRSQRTHPVRHPRHVAGAMMVHATGMLGFVHAYHVLGLRHADGWVGYGTHIHSVVFRKMVEPGESIDCECRALKSRIGSVRHFIRYRFEFRHQGEVCYEGEQSAVWLKVADGATAAPALA